MRSRIAEAFAKQCLGPGDDILVQASGLEKDSISGLPVRLMKSDFDLYVDQTPPPTLFDVYDSGVKFDYVITLSSGGLPVTQCDSYVNALYRPEDGLVRRSWDIKPFKGLPEDEETRIEITLQIIQLIKDKVQDLITEIRGSHSGVSSDLH
ncbi:MAG: hypothetical protein CMF25_06050 [Kangiellaceae bacterium]|jgi:protein-tyrosine-phosphatase|nr:hypothetical protein [Kangiellaceae bacterium]